MFPVFPCLLGFLLGWAIWDRWRAQIATILVCGFFLAPLAAAASLRNPTRDVRTLLLAAASYGTSIVLTEVGVQLRDRFELRHGRRPLQRLWWGRVENAGGDFRDVDPRFSATAYEGGEAG